ncbi:helix-turn-helix domain-containing protein [Nocardia farcinica]|uniref:helix-turn-helix domain-containing protein n=1 Tax=Nocardia farcinica TaxID=37329 RepID=UPI0018950F45|nr:helix-turn-helix transcriptional regulator [Nocardia farcinica]MBF6070099.1 helix-turn-helix domain-containing protein [Nocardia farcinica]MBF6291029.1 helix-turn-helix domain-containing protein [Nocardia farcinica]MBF6362710.1 helix-turn-helix domain-containing protein [Nocardia farcinica]MBF6372202.1 helix-turn-helix domain-containing protein [Nocardia farcinica]MBF6379033.1 helix-turn-helix domain-containing protein [Nocardia farcinica]
MADGDSTLPRRQLGRLLHRYRDEVGLSLARAARLVDIGTTTLHRLEKGQANKVRLGVVQQLCEIYERSPEEIAAARYLASQGAVKSWYVEYGELTGSDFDNYVVLESAARRLISYHELVPGLLQTADYARSVLRYHYLDRGETVIERLVELRLQRQIRVKRKALPIELDVLVHQSALHRVVGSRRVMANQLRHLADASTLPNVTLRVVPFSAGIPMGVLPGGFVILEFGCDRKGRLIEPSVVFVEGVLTAGIFLEKDTDVDRYRAISAGLHKAALDEAGSRTLLRRMAKEYLA